MPSVIRCSDMQSYYATMEKQKATLDKYRTVEPDPATTTVEEQALLNSIVEPPPLQVVLDFWLAEILHELKQRN